MELTLNLLFLLKSVSSILILPTKKFFDINRIKKVCRSFDGLDAEMKLQILLMIYIEDIYVYVLFFGYIDSFTPYEY